MKLKAVAFAALAVCGTAVNAESMKDDYVGCVSEEALDQFTQALVKKDQRGMDYLLSTRCVPTSSKFPISVIDYGVMTTKYRVYIGSEAIELYSPTEAIQR